MKQKWKRPLALLLSVAMMFSMSGTPVYAADVEMGASAVCPHHVHDETCGYSEGTPCTHEHTDDCYTLVTQCVHEHTAECYSDGILPAEGEEKAADACTHVCSEESGCITKELNCPHVHDETCGYSEGSPCTFDPSDCELCNPTDSGEPEAPAECICETLCTADSVNPDCPVCDAEGADLAACAGIATESETPACICETKCVEGAVNPDCPVCGAEGADLTVCQGETADQAALAEQTVSTWAADAPVTYMTWDEAQRKSVSATCSEYTALSNESISTTWGAGWYVLDADKEFSARITLQGDVYLILMDGYTLTAIGGIGLSSGSSLTIYGQENDTGTLIATAAEGDAGIGGNGYKGADASGDITICGGTVVATGGTEGGAGIGSGRDDRTNIEITIYGGIVKATGGTDAAGIGSSPGGSIDYITLAGGTIEAAHGEVKRQDIESMYNGEEDAPYDVGPGWKGSMKARMSFVAGSGGVDDDKGEPVLQSGSSNGTTYSRYVVDISGGNLYTTGGGNALTTENPYNGNYGELDSDSKAVYCAVADLGAAYAGESVSGTITVNGEEYLYNFNGVRADANGKLHLYLFAGEAALSVDGIDFEYTGTIDADNHTLQPTLGGTIYFNETTPYQDKLTVNTDTVTPDSYRDNLTYTWYRCDDSTGANATLIEGANTSTYTLTDKDQGKYIKVEVSAAGFEGNPLSTVSHKVGSDTAANILRITGATLDTKAYDGTGDWDVQNVSFDAATLTMGEDYTATASIVGTNYNAGGFKKVTVTVTLLNSAYTFEGDETEATYTLTGQTVVPATLTVASATALNRNVDDTTTVQITGVTLTGVIGSEDVSVDTTGLTGELSGSTAGSYDTVRFTQDLTLTGADASNYTLTQPTEAVTLDPAVILKGAVVDQDSNGVYQIQTEDDLFWFAALVNGTLTDGTDQDLDASAVLCSDIVISSDRTWIPIGDYSANTRNKYAGTFDGAGHTIDGLKADGGSAQGFVGYMDGGTIKNCTFNGTVTSSGSAGGICGSNYGTIENCTFNGTVTGSGNGSAGGICGSNSNSGTIKNCTSYGKVTSSKGNTGGICGYNSSTVTGCTNNAAVEGYFYFGGICGFNTGTITNCINKGEVKLTASQGRYVGGICGYSTNTITNCISSGKINGTCAAGICAWNSTTGTVTNCYWLTSSIGGTGVYDNDGTQDKVESKTATEFASGEVCWLLNNSSSESPVWYQNVDSGTMDNYPVLDSSHGVVYASGLNCAGMVCAYSNTEPEGELPQQEHEYDQDGFCTVCDAYQPANWNSSGVYEITNAGQLFWFAGLVNGTLTDGTEQNTSASAVLTADIELSGETWTPIGSESTPYTGTFDGQGYTISGMTIENAESYSGLFGNVTGTVKNFTVTGSITITGDETVAKVGGAVGSLGTASAGGTVSGVISGVDITVSAGNDHIGGVVGSMPENSSPTVENCIYTGKITVTVAAGSVAGIVGYIRTGTIQNCANQGSISVDVGGTGSVGGILGYCNNGRIYIRNCYNTGAISADGTDNVGAIVGQNKGTQATVSNCYYLTGSANQGQGQLTTDAAGTVVKTADEFASGEVTYLLNGSTSEDLTWYQNLGDDGDRYPVLDTTHGIVYLEDGNYTNTLTVISVDITWGDLSFTYSDGTWNPDTHEYENDGWTVDNEGGNSIKLENTGNTDVNVTYDYKAVENGITGSFTDGENPVSAPVALPENGSSTVYLILAGKPEQNLDHAKIGSVTVTIGGESE